MKFSIITPSLNQGRYIGEAIESVRSQAPEVYEHIIIDGGSTDETVAILQEYPHLRWVSESDNGQSDAINKGFRQATGDWLMWLNADDYLRPDALSRVRQFVATRPEADVIYGNCDFVDEQHQLVKRKREFDFSYSMLLFYGCYIPSTATFYRREIIQRGQLLDTHYRVCMDYEYYLRLGHAGFRFYHLPETLANFRWHDSNVSSLQVGREGEERWEIQQTYLMKAQRSWLARRWLLYLLFRAYQLYRTGRRMARRLSGS